MPTLLLQPLVENAIKHGVARRTGCGQYIDITAHREHDKLLIEVRDDGEGLSEDALTALQKASASRRRTPGRNTCSAPITASNSTGSRRGSRWRGCSVADRRNAKRSRNNMKKLRTLIVDDEPPGRRAAGQPAFGRTGY